MQKLVWNKSKCMKTNFYHDILQVVWVKLLLKIRACWRWWRSVLSSNFCDHCGWLGNICLYLPSHKSPDRGTRITFLCFNTFWKSLQQLRKWMEMFRHWTAGKIVSHFEILFWCWLPTNRRQIIIWSGHWGASRLCQPVKLWTGLNSGTTPSSTTSWRRSTRTRVTGWLSMLTWTDGGWMGAPYPTIWWCLSRSQTWWSSTDQQPRQRWCCWSWQSPGTLPTPSRRPWRGKQPDMSD